jgi:hypothetical protein
MGSGTTRKVDNEQDASLFIADAQQYVLWKVVGRQRASKTINGRRLTDVHFCLSSLSEGSSDESKRQIESSNGTVINITTRIFGCRMDSVCQVVKILLFHSN